MTPKREIEIERFQTVIERISTAFPNLRIDVGPATAHVDATAEMPVQTGLGFTISLNLSGDELYLGAGSFWVEWFPIGRPTVVDDYVEAVLGLLSGDYRIVESYLFGRAVRARLERPDRAGKWKTIATWSNEIGLIPWSSGRRVLQNRVASRN